MQSSIFHELNFSDMSIDEAARVANVSTATIRNWIKTGYLDKQGKGLISRNSLQKFMTEVAGKQKLNSRANKLLKDRHDHKDVTEKINLLLERHEGEEIGFEYEKSLSDSYRNKEGIYYTPSWVIKDMYKYVKFSPELKFLDPCCGSGNFIIEAIKNGVDPQNVYGFDVDPNAVLITKKRIKDEFGFEAVNIKVGDFLGSAQPLRNENLMFDLIFTNPPWGKKIEKSEKEKYSKIYGCGNSLDTTSLFLGASLSVLNPNGVMGFLIQEAFFNITTFEDVRKNVIIKKILRMVDYGKTFKGILTKAQAIIIQNTKGELNHCVECCIENKTFKRTMNSFLVNPKHIFNFWANESEAEVISQLYTKNYTTLKGKANWALGVVTGNNEKFCTRVQKEGYLPIYKGSDITKTGLKEPTTFIPNDFSAFQQVAPLEMYLANEKLIYKFISSDLCFYYDTHKRYILNSANLLIPCNLEISANQLTKLLNSQIMNWLFNKLFSTHKVLRGDLELLPLHIDYYNEYSEFTEKQYLDYLQIKKIEDGTYRIKK